MCTFWCRSRGSRGPFCGRHISYRALIRCVRAQEDIPILVPSLGGPRARSHCGTPALQGYRAPCPRLLKEAKGQKKAPASRCLPVPALRECSGAHHEEFRVTGHHASNPRCRVVGPIRCGHPADPTARKWSCDAVLRHVPPGSSKLHHSARSLIETRCAANNTYNSGPEHPIYPSSITRSILLPIEVPPVSTEANSTSKNMLRRRPEGGKTCQSHGAFGVDPRTDHVSARRSPMVTEPAGFRECSVS